MALALESEARTVKGSSKTNWLRSTGKIPAVVYNPGKPSTLISIDENEFNKAFMKGEREFELKVENKTTKAKVKDVQWDALGEAILHVDFTPIG